MADSGTENKGFFNDTWEKILWFIFLIMIFVNIFALVGVLSIVYSQYELGDLNYPGGGAGGKLNENCEHILTQARPYIGYVNESAQKHGVDPALVAAIIEKESSWNPNATSHAGAMGLMQLMPGTAAGLGVTNAYDPQQNIDGGTRYIKAQLDRFGGKLNWALAAYNAGPERVEQYNGIPPYAETQDYVKRVLEYYEKYKECLMGGGIGDVSEYGFMWPVIGTTTGFFGNPRSHGTHNGIDIDVPKGTVVYAAKGGTVIAAGTIDSRCGWGVQINHGDGFQTVYCHLSNVGVSTNTKVEIGQNIGLSGGVQGEPGSGSSTGKHLHFGMIKDGKFVDPLIYLP